MRILKKIFKVVLVLFLLGILAAAGLHFFIYPFAVITVKAVDANNNPLENANVSASFDLINLSDILSGISRSKDGKTRENGTCTIISISSKNHCRVSVRKDGFYESYGGFQYSAGLVFWWPLNPTITIVLKKKINPVPMFAKKYSVESLKVPVLDTSVGYDLEKGDWVTPYGKGLVRDFIFICKVNYVSIREWQCSYKLTFSNALDGIQEYITDKNERSEYRWPYEAPDTGYRNEFIWSNAFNNKTYDSGLDRSKRYIFRTRTKTDDNGNIIGATYGKIQEGIWLSAGGFLSFEYYFNPTGNKSLEYNTRNPLFKWSRKEVWYEAKEP